MVIKDQATAPVKVGRYRLVTHCAGEGTLYAQLTIGAVTQVAELPPCTPTAAATGTLEVDVTEPSDQLLVTIIPVGTTRAAVAYTVETATTTPSN